MSEFVEPNGGPILIPPEPLTGEKNFLRPMAGPGRPDKPKPAKAAKQRAIVAIATRQRCGTKRVVWREEAATLRCVALFGEKKATLWLGLCG